MTATLPSPQDIRQPEGAAGLRAVIGSAPVYRDKYVTLYHGDNLEVMKQLDADSFDVTLTSPPYNLNDPEATGSFPTTGKWGASKIQNGYENFDDAMPHADYCEWQRALLNECWRVTRGAIYYNHKPRPVNGEIRLPLEWWPLPLRQIIIWARAGGVNFSKSHYCPTHEWIMLAAKPDFRLKNRGASGVGDVWQIPQELNTLHPAPFPLDLAGRVIETSGAQSIFDPYAGSGTTLVAAKLANIQAVGIEKSKTYCDLIIRRLSQDVLPLGCEAQNGQAD